MDDLQKAAISVGLYFGVLFAVFLTSFKSLFSSRSVKGILFAVLGLASLTVAWVYIFRWFFQEYKDFADSLSVTENTFVQWIKDANLFDKAYLEVVTDEKGWVWSQNLLLLTLSIALLMFTEGSARVNVGPGQEKLLPGKKGMMVRSKSKTFLSSWRFLILGFLGAMSTCFAWFLSHLSQAEDSYVITRPKNLPIWVSAMFMLSLLTIVLTPILRMTSFFGISLKLLHVFLFLPVFFASGFRLTQKPGPYIKHVQNASHSIASLYGFIAGSSLISHIFALLKAFPMQTNMTFQDLVGDLYNAIWINPCQTSITMDLIFGSIVAIVFMLMEGIRYNHVFSTVILVILTPVLSPAFTLPWFLSNREMWIHTSLDRLSNKKQL